MTEMKNKLIGFPEKILEILDNYKTQTGTSSTEYIRNAVCKMMIIDGLMIIKPEVVYYKQNKKGKQKIMNNSNNMDAINSNSFCDGDKCELPAPMLKGGGC